MFKFVTSNENFYLKALNNRILKRFVVFNITKLEYIDNDEIYNKIVTNIFTSNNTSKETRINRFNDLDEYVYKYINNDKINEIHDVAVSSGQTSYELYMYLRLKKIKFKLYISDKFNKYFFTGNKFVKVYDVNGVFVLGYVFFILAYNSLCINNLFIITKTLGILLSKSKIDLL